MSPDLARGLRIDALGLATRTANVLMGVRRFRPGETIELAETIGEVVDHLAARGANLHHLRNCGRKTIREILERLRGAGVPPEITDQLHGGHDAESDQTVTLLAFFYLLARDSLPAGEVIRIIREAKRAGINEPAFTSAPIEAFARGAVRELLG